MISDDEKFWEYCKENRFALLSHLAIKNPYKALAFYVPFLCICGFATTKERLLFGLSIQHQIRQEKRRNVFDPSSPFFKLKRFVVFNAIYVYRQSHFGTGISAANRTCTCC